MHVELESPKVIDIPKVIRNRHEEDEKGVLNNRILLSQ